ncbi:MAG: hypothetical protein IKX86_02190 [Clostridia bacterium]|nr:hypothetical protein [Clostridia bacterium]
MKKITALIIALIMVLAVFAGCQGGEVKPGNDTTVKQGNDTKKADDTTKKAEETTNKTEETTPKAEETEDPNALPTKRTAYTTDPRTKLDLLDQGVDIVLVPSFVQGKGVIVNAVMDSDGKIDAEIADWDVINTNCAQFTNDGKNKYFPFIGFKKAVTINEAVIGDVTAWCGNDEDGNPKWTLYTDYSDLEVWYTDNPNGTWTKWECTAEPFENPDFGILYGSYPQGISFKGEDVTARYFLIYDPDPKEGELWIACNLASPAVIYNPPAA